MAAGAVDVGTADAERPGPRYDAERRNEADVRISFPRSHALRGNVRLDAPRRVFQVLIISVTSQSVATGRSHSSQRNWRRLIVANAPAKVRELFGVGTADAERPGWRYDAERRNEVDVRISFPRSHALRGNARLDAPRRWFQVLIVSVASQSVATGKLAFKPA